MALKQIMLNKRKELKNKELEAVREKEAELDKREADLIQAIGEASTDEEQSAVESEMEAFEADKAENEEAKKKLEEELEEIEGELKELEEKEPETSERGNKDNMKKRTEIQIAQRGIFRSVERSMISDALQREDVKEFLQRTREFISSKRAVTGGELGIPTVLLEMLRDNMNQYSKLISKVSLKSVRGIARQNVAGAIPEGVWTEAVGTLNELAISFGQVEVDGYKVGGYIAIPNSTLEDSDFNLANEILTAIAQSIGLAVDKAILYGTGSKMPVGIVKRLAETVKPSYYGDKETWTDLHTSNLLLISAAATTDVAFYKDLILKLGKAKANYSNGQKFWAMNSDTFASLQAKALTINAAGAIVSAQTNTMPIVGGDIVTLDFIPDDVIIGGYGSLYILAERAGASLAQSEHVKFIEDNTVFKGTARYDGRPIFGEGFVAINISQADLQVPPVANAVSFASDTANA